jgi:type I restriction enzyme, R subunit
MPQMTQEKVIEEDLIKTLTERESQWTYCPEITDEESLWQNFRHILEQNNKAILNDTPLTEEEFKKIKNDVTHSSFYEAAKWLVGENGKVLAHIQRGNEVLHLTVLDNNMIAGGNSVYQVINQYRSFKNKKRDRNRRFDVSLLINGIPLIHIELKNRTHSYMDGFHQIKKYISEGKFKGLFSNVQMFVVSNVADTKYFASARGEELNPKFLTGWVDNNNNPVGDLTRFAESVLKIPTAHEMVSKYTVLDTDNKRLIVLRPYQIHAIEAIREASKQNKSGYIWHTTGSGKTLTSYKVTRNLLSGIPSIDKTIFLVDRKDLDTQTGDDFMSYAENDIVDVKNTEHVGMLIKRLTDGNREMIVTTRQKLQIMMKRLKEGSRDYNTVKHLRIAFVVDECHRSISPSTKRELEKYFKNSLWYGFTGTPIFKDNAYSIKGDLPTTTEEMYGECLHKYTIKDAIKDGAVLGFNIDYLGKEDEPEDVINSKAHMRGVLNTIVNKGKFKLGLENGAGRTYSAILTVDSIGKAQEYYKLLKEVKEGKDKLTINEDIKKLLPDFPKFAITYSLSENEASSHVNQSEMADSIDDYNGMFGTNFSVETINSYNTDLANRLSRKNGKYDVRAEQLDLVIVVDRLLTGFNAPCLSTIYLDRPPMKPQHLIQAFSRTNRLYDRGKESGRVVTCQLPETYRVLIDEALTLYSAGGSASDGKCEEWDKVFADLKEAVKKLRDFTPTPEDCLNLETDAKKKIFIDLFRAVDNKLAHLKAFDRYIDEEDMIKSEINLSDEDYEKYVGHYINFVEELSTPGGEGGDDIIEGPEDYDLLSYATVKVDFEYIVHLIQLFVDSSMAKDDIEFERRLYQLKEIVDSFKDTNEKLGEILGNIITQLSTDRDALLGQSVSEVIADMIHQAIVERATEYAKKWYFDVDDVVYEIYHYRHDEISNETKFKEKADYEAYKEATEEPLNKLKFKRELVKEFHDPLMKEVDLLLNKKY